MMRTGRLGPSTSSFLDAAESLFNMVYYEVTSRRRLGGRCFSLSQDFCSSRAADFLAIDNARINPETHERWYLRVCTRLLFQNLRVLSSLRIQISCFWRPALGPLAFSSPRGSRAGSRSDTKPGSGAKPRADPRETRFLRLAPRTQSYARAKCCAALPSLA